MTCCISCPQVFPRSHICSVDKQNSILPISKTFFVCRLHPELQNVLKKRFLAAKEQAEQNIQIEQYPEENYIEPSSQIQVEEEAPNSSDIAPLNNNNPEDDNMEESMERKVEIIPNEVNVEQ